MRGKARQLIREAIALVCLPDRIWSEVSIEPMENACTFRDCN